MFLVIDIYLIEINYRIVFIPTIDAFTYNHEIHTFYLVQLIEHPILRILNIFCLLFEHFFHIKVLD